MSRAPDGLEPYKFAPPPGSSASAVEDYGPSVTQREVAPRTGTALVLRSGQILRIGQPEGPQVCDFNAYAEGDTSEQFWSGRTRILEGAHLSTSSTLWSTRVRPMFIIVADTARDRPSAYRGRLHDLIFARCSRELWRLVEGRDEPNSCQDNLAGAIAGFGLGPEHVHDAFNIFMRTGIDPADDRLFNEPTDTSPGDYVDLLARMDAIVAVSLCPLGDATPDRVCSPLTLEVFDGSE